MCYVFRLRVRLAKGIRPGDIPGLLDIDGLPPIELTRQALSWRSPNGPDTEKSTQKYSNFHTFIARGFPSEESAKSAGECFTKAVQMYGAITHLGVDVGFNRSAAEFGQNTKDIIREKFDRELRSETLGLMIYKNDSVAIVGINTNLTIEAPIDPLEAGLKDWYSVSEHLSERQLTCAALLNDTFFVGRAEAKFVLAISAVEALCAQENAPPEQLSAIATLCQTLNSIDVSKTVRESLLRTLERGRKKSIRQAYMEKLRSLLGDQDANLFDKLYSSRSAFVHEGRGRGALEQLANDAHSIAVRLLDADVKSLAGIG